MRPPSITLWVFAFGTLLSSSVAQAFEQQSYVGGGLGVSNYDRAQSLAPLVNLYGAYGLSDSFDARLDLMSAWPLPVGASERRWLSSALVACTYKLDVIQWIPWGGLAIGAHHLSGNLAGPKRNAFEPGVSLLFGLDYAWSRYYGLSLAFGLHALPFAEDRNPMALRYTTSILRFERRFGW